MLACSVATNVPWLGVKCSSFSLSCNYNFICTVKLTTFIYVYFIWFTIALQFYITIFTIFWKALVFLIPFLFFSLIHFILVKSAPHISHILSLKYGYTFHAFYLLFYATYLLIGLMLYKLSPNISILLLKGFWLLICFIIHLLLDFLLSWVFTVTECTFLWNHCFCITILWRF